MLSCNKLQKTIGKNVADLRKSKDFSQEKLAEKVNLHRNQIGRIERGEINLPVFTLYRIAEALKVPSDKIIPF